MATYEVNGPNGEAYNVEGPEGASPEQVFSVLQQHLASQAPASSPQETPGPGKTLLHSAERGVAPTAAAFAGMAAAQPVIAPIAAMTGPLAPVTELAGSLIAGGVAAWGASKLQEKALQAMPTVAKSLGQDQSTQAQEQQAHPVLSQVGEALPSLAAFRPSTDILKGGEAALSALKSSVTNSVINAGLEAGSQAAGDQPMDYSRILTQGAIGAAGMKPTALGRRMLGIPGEPNARPETPTATESEAEAPPKVTPPATDDEARSALLAHINSDQVSSKKNMQEATGVSAPDVTKFVNELKEQEVIKYNSATKQWEPTGKEYSKPVPLEAPAPEPVSVDDLLNPHQATEAPQPDRLSSEAPAHPLSDGTADNIPPELSPSGVATLPAEESGASSLQGETGGGRADTTSEPVIAGPSVDESGGSGRSMGVPVARDTSAEGESITRPLINGGLDDAQANAGGPDDRAAGVEHPVKKTLPTDEQMRRAGLTESEIRNMKNPAKTDWYKAQQIKDGYKYIAGEFRQPTQEDADLYRQGEARDQQEKAQKKAQLDQYWAGREADGGRDPGYGNELSRILGSDWNSRGGNTLKESSYNALNQGWNGWRGREADAIEQMLKERNPVKNDKPVSEVARRIAALRRPDQPAVETPGGKTPEDLEIEEYLKRVPKPVSSPEIVNRVRDTGLRFADNPKGWTSVEPEDAWFTDRGTPKDKVQQVVNEATQGWTNKPNIYVHDSIDTVPEPLRSTLPRGVLGVSHKGDVHLIASNIESPERARSIVYHESLGHYGLKQNFDGARRQVMNNIYDTNPRMKALADKWLDVYNDKSYVQKMSVPMRRAYAVEEELARASESGPIKDAGLRAAFNRAAAMIRNFGRRMGMVKTYSDNDVRQILLDAHARVMSGDKLQMKDTSGTKNFATKTPPAHQDRSAPELIKDWGTDAKGKKYSERYNSPSITERIKNNLSKEGYRKLVRNLQNYREPLKTLENQMRQGNLTHAANAVYTEATLADGKVTDNAHAITPHAKQLTGALAEYAKREKIPIEQARATFDAYLTAQHEPERRHTNFLQNVPLNNTTKLQVGQHLMTPADMRAELNKQMIDPKNAGKTPAMMARIEQLVNQYKDVNGYSPRKGPKAGSLLESDAQYNVAGDYTRNEIQNLRLAMQNDPHQDLVKLVQDKVKAIQEISGRMDTEANYRSVPVQNLIDAYGWKNYIPLKGNSNLKDSPYEITGKRVSGELNQFAERFEGRDNDSESPILQVLADAGRAAGRSARKDFTDSVVNLIKSGGILGKFKKTVTPQERMDGTTREDIQGENRIFHYQPNGNVDVYSINDKNMLEAVKGFQKDVGPIWRGLNSINSFVGQLHTRFAPSFAPFNAVRHMMTSGAMFGAESGGYLKGPAQAARFVGRVSANLANPGRLVQTARLWALRGESPEKYAASIAKSAWGKDLDEYLSTGGGQEFYRGLSIKSQTDELTKLVNQNGFSNSLDTVRRWFDIYNNSFEMTGRVAAYRVVKDDLISKGASPTDPNIIKQAAAYTKNLFNYQQIGKYGREAGSLYMFLRPSMTTAVRALDAIAPAFQSVDKAVADFSGHYNGATPENIDHFKSTQIAKQQSARALMIGMMGSGFAVYHMAKLMSDDDEQGRNKVGADDLAQWQRNMRLPLPGHTGADFLQIPYGFGLGSFGAAGAQLAAVGSGSQSLWEGIKNLIPVALDSYMPLPVVHFNVADHPLAATLLSAAPTFARPFLGYAMNINDFGSQVVSEHANAYSGGDDLYSAATKLMADSSNGAVNISPTTLRYWAQAYTDGYAQIAHDATGDALSLAGAREGDLSKATMILNHFFGKESNKDARDYAETAQRVADLEGKLKMFQNNPEQAEKYNEANPNAQLIVKVFNTQSAMLKEISKQINRIQASPDVSMKERAEMLKELNDQRNWVKASVVQAVKDYQD